MRVVIYFLAGVGVRFLQAEEEEPVIRMVGFLIEEKRISRNLMNQIKSCYQKRMRPGRRKKRFFFALIGFYKPGIKI